MFLRIASTCLGLAALAPSALAQYCAASYDATADWIERVEVVGVGGNTSGAGGSGYENFTSTSLPLTPGQTYTIEADVMTVFQGGGDFRLDFWIDYDQDQIFEPSEHEELAVPQFYTSNSLHTRSTTFTVPLSASAGPTRMRVSFRFFSLSASPDPCSPCGTPCFGQVEDYTVDTQAGPTLCDSASGSAASEHLSRVAMSGVATSSGPSTYTDNGSVQIPIAAGGTHTLEVDVDNTSGGMRSVNVYAWIDFDQDLVFANSERTIVAAGAAIAPGTTSFSAAVAVPPGAGSPTVMRATVKNASGGVPTPCETGFDGEVEDYGIRVLDYCPVSYDAADEWIERVEIVGIGANVSGPGGSGYQDFTATLFEPLAPGLTYSVEADVRTNFQSGATLRLDMWIDSNADGTFDGSEHIEIAPPQFYPSNIVHTRGTTFSLPAFAANGNTRMRVSYRVVAGQSNPDPCNPCGTCFGQLEDYTVGIFRGRASNYCDRSPNSVDPIGAAISASGSLAISDNSMVLSAAPVPNTTGLFFFGTTQVNTPFGAGRRCVGGQTRRLLPPTSGQANVATRNVNFMSGPASGIQPGQTRNFQYWFRDPMMGGFNLSDGLEVFFAQ